MSVSNTNIVESEIWNSLFLPIKKNVMFASFITMLSPLQPNEEQPDLSEPKFSVPESNPSNGLDKTESGQHNAETNATRSPLFALCGERADAIVCVLEDRQVVFFDLTDGQQGPKEVRRFSGTSQLHGFRSSVATCASLIPLEVAYMCRIPSLALPSTVLPDSGNNGHDVNTLTSLPTTNKTIYLRGVVGSSDGRVDIFSEDGYVFGFVAHDAPLASVTAIYSIADSEESSNGDSSAHDNNNNNNSAIVYTNNNDGDNDNEKKRKFEEATAGIGFVTCSNEGVVYIWRLENLTLKPRLFEKSTFLSRRFKLHVIQPSNRDLLLSGMRSVQHPILVHTTPGKEHKLCARSTITFNDVENRVELPGSFFTRTTAVAADEKIALVARGRNVYKVLFSESQCHLVFTASYTVTGIYINKNGFAAITCNQKGLIYILTLPSLTVLGRYNVRGEGPIRSISLHPASYLIIIVTENGTVEVVLMPSEWNNKKGRDIYSSTDVLETLQAAKALHCLVELQREEYDVMTEDQQGVRRSELHESLLLARMAVPKETKRYLHNTAEIA